MRSSGLTTALIVMTALCLTACASSRRATEVSSRTEERRVEVRDTVRETVLVAVHDTVTITNTITYVVREPQEPNAAPDTIKVVQLTDRATVRDRDRLRVQDSRLKVKTDSVSVERDTLQVCCR